MKRTCICILIVFALLFGFSGFVGAEVHSRFVTGFTTPEPPQNTTFIIANTLNFADLKVKGNAGTELSGVSKSDTVQLLSIPAGTIVKDVGINIYSAWSTAGLTCYGVTLGDGTTTDGWLLSVDFGPSASGVSRTGGVSSWTIAGNAGTSIISAPKYAYAGGKYYSAADTIDATIPAVDSTNNSYARCTDFVLRVWAECIKPSTQYRYKRTGY